MIEDTENNSGSEKNPYRRYVTWTLNESIIFSLLGILVAYFSENTLGKLLGIGVMAVAIFVYFAHKKFFAKFAEDWDRNASDEKEI